MFKSLKTIKSGKSRPVGKLKLRILRLQVRLPTSPMPPCLMNFAPSDPDYYQYSQFPVTSLPLVFPFILLLFFFFLFFNVFAYSPCYILFRIYVFFIFCLTPQSTVPFQFFFFLENPEIIPGTIDPDKGCIAMVTPRIQGRLSHQNKTWRLPQANRMPHVIPAKNLSKKPWICLNLLEFYLRLVSQKFRLQIKFI